MAYSLFDAVTTMTQIVPLNKETYRDLKVDYIIDLDSGDLRLKGFTLGGVVRF